MIAGKRRTVVEEEGAFFRLQVVRIVGDRPVGFRESNQPHVVAVGAVIDREVTGIELPDGRHVIIDGVVQHHVLGAGLHERHHLNLTRVGVHHGTAYVVLRIPGHHLSRLGSEVEPDEARGIGVLRIDQVERRAVQREPQRPAGERILRRPGDQRTPLALVAIANEELGTTVRGECHRSAHLEPGVGNPGHDISRILSDQVEQIRGEVEVIDVVEPNVVLVYAE